MIEFALEKKYDQGQFMAFLKTFLPDDYNQHENEVDITFKSNFITSAISLGTCNGIDLEVYAIKHTSLNDARVGLSKDAFRLLVDQSWHNRALVAFIPEEGGQWRLSLLQMEAEVNDRTARITRSYSNPRRYSFLLGEGAHVKTPHQFLFEKGQIRERRENGKQLTEWDDLLSRFSVEVLTKNFYNELFDWYTWAIDPKTGIYFPNNPNTADDDRDKIDVKIIRLITRLMFVWFIKQKQLVPEKLFDPAYIKSILKNFDAQSSDSGLYYNAILQNLFFASLNRPVIDDEGKTRDFRSNYSDEIKQPSNLYRFDDEFCFDPDKQKNQEGILELFSKVPYLNAGLFECLDKTKEMDGVDPPVYFDGFSSNNKKFKNGRYRQRAFIPNVLFFAKEKGIIDILSKYNFTVEENTPTDQQVALDPELLGKVFENLLGAYNPETQETARNSTGSFYTPREIVQYMVDESLIEHLKLHVGKDLEPEFRKLLSFSEEDFSFTEQQKQDILKAIYNCKVLDPACGSGAFPMGMLQQMVHIISRIDTENTLWKDIVLERAIEDSKEAFKTESKEERQAKLQSIEETFDQAIENPDYTRKLYLIENCIYGVDIQPIAMMISKLRFFISLVCEQENINLDDPEHNFGVNTLPNLETKFVAANTLLDADIRKYKDDWTNDEHLMKLKDELLAIRHRHFYAQKRSQKRRILKEDKDKREEISNYIITNTAKADDAIIKKNKELIGKYFVELEQYRDKKMEEVEAPGDLFGPTQKVLVDVNAPKRRELQDRIKACEEAIRREENKKNPTGFEAAVKQVTEWDPYNQNSSSPFLDIEWMFGMREKFDIVIANPPYVLLQALNDPDTAKTYKEEYEVAVYKVDLYHLFIERGLHLLTENGVLTYINPTNFLTNNYAIKLREFILQNTEVKNIINIEDEVFCASVNTCIQQLIKHQNTNCSLSYCRGSLIDKHLEVNVLSEVEQTYYLNEEGLVIQPVSSMGNLLLINKISKESVLLKDLAQVNFGMQLRNRKVYTTDVLVNPTPDQLTPFHRKCLTGKDINPYKTVWGNRYCYFNEEARCGGCWIEEVHNRKNKVLVRQVGATPICSIDTEGLAVLNSAFMISCTKINPYGLLGILNSKLGKFYWSEKFEDKRKTFPKIKGSYLELMPIVEPTDQICSLVKEIVNDTSNGIDTIVKEEQLDNLIYRLYHITEDEVLLIEKSLLNNE